MEGSKKEKLESEITERGIISWKISLKVNLVCGTVQLREPEPESQSAIALSACGSAGGPGDMRGPWLIGLNPDTLSGLSLSLISPQGSQATNTMPGLLAVLMEQWYSSWFMTWFIITARFLLCVF